MSDHWWVRGADGEVKGPWSAEDIAASIRSGRLQLFSYVSQDRMTWVPATSVPALVQGPSDGAPSAPQPAPLPPTPPQSNATSASLSVLMAIGFFACACWVMTKDLRDQISPPAASAPTGPAGPACDPHGAAHARLGRVGTGADYLVQALPLLRIMNAGRDVQSLGWSALVSSTGLSPCDATYTYEINGVSHAMTFRYFPGDPGRLEAVNDGAHGLVTIVESANPTETPAEMSAPPAPREHRRQHRPRRHQ